MSQFFLVQFCTWWYTFAEYSFFGSCNYSCCTNPLYKPRQPIPWYDKAPLSYYGLLVPVHAFFFIHLFFFFRWVGSGEKLFENSIIPFNLNSMMSLDYMYKCKHYHNFSHAFVTFPSCVLHTVYKWQIFSYRFIKMINMESVKHTTIYTLHNQQICYICTCSSICRRNVIYMYIYAYPTRICRTSGEDPWPHPKKFFSHRWTDPRPVIYTLNCWVCLQLWQLGLGQYGD